jgi:hypothetical protein
MVTTPFRTGISVMEKRLLSGVMLTWVQGATHEITLNAGAVKDLTISFVYDSNQPTKSSLVVKEKNEVLRTVEQDPVMGPYFVVPVRELIGTHQPNVQYVLDFYYSDDRGQKNLRLGTIIFNLK